MRFYTGNQWQDNAVGNTGSFFPNAFNSGTYCVLNAENSPVIFGVTPQPYTLQFAFIATTFYVYANSGVTGGTIQPQILLADGQYRDYGSLLTLTSPGFALSVTVPTPILGAQFKIIGAVTGGTVFLEIDALLN